MIEATTAEPYRPADTIQFFWLLRNTAPIPLALTGDLALSVDGRTVTASFPKVQNLQRHATLSGVFYAGPLAEGTVQRCPLNRKSGPRLSESMRGFAHRPLPSLSLATRRAIKNLLLP
jgi:hypothetical protein